jgi:hypothetical protein
LLFALRVEARLQAALALGLGERRLAVVDGGSYEGPRLKGRVTAGGIDWLLARPDAVREIDARVILREEDGQVIAMRYSGYRTAQPEVLARASAGESVDPGAFIYRTAHFFEASGRCAWLNDVVGMGLGARCAEGLVYRVYQLS